MVYVFSETGQPLMPTENHSKVRILLKTHKAVVIKRCPFTIKLLYKSTTYTQSISLGIDAGSKHIGLSATTEEKVLYESDVELRQDIAKLLSSRRELRRTRRSRKTRYRASRFNNSVYSKHEGWLAPSIEERIGSHLTAVKHICEILPISNIVVEVASFDIQKIKNPTIEGTDYQQGEQLGFWNIREYVLFRDNHECQCCHGKSKDHVLNVHHIESRQTGGDAPNNLITLCETCHTGYHKGMVMFPKTIHRNMHFRDAAFMGIMRWTFYNKLKEQYNIPVNMTYGYITKHTRIQYNLPKEHFIDARCISGHSMAKPSGEVFYQKKIRCHNRRLHKNTIMKGGIRKNNQAPFLVKGYQLFDTVKYHGQEYFIFGRRTSGAFDIRTLIGDKINNGSISYKKLTFVNHNRNFLTERRTHSSHD